MSRYITLPCTASSNAFPENTRARYRTLLKNELILTGPYEAGICEVLIPVPKININIDSEMLYGNTVESLINVFSVRKEECIDLIKLKMPVNKAGKPIFKFNLNKQKNELQVFEGIVKFSSGPLSNLLGLRDNYYGVGKYIGNPSDTPIAYVYCDICEYSIVGDSMVPCLRVVPLNRESKPTHVCFDNIYYIPVDGARFTSLEVVISSDLGDEFDFSEGTTYIILHVRPKK